MDGKRGRITLLCVYVGDEIMASKFVICVGSKKHKLLRCICTEDKPSNAFLVVSQHPPPSGRGVPCDVTPSCRSDPPRAGSVIRCDITVRRLLKERLRGSYGGR